MQSSCSAMSKHITDPQSDPKSRLQAFAQRAGMPLPVYQTFNEVNQHPHMPQFRSRLWVDGTLYMSSTASTSKKAAEQNVAEHALVAVIEKVKNDGRAYVRQDTMLCKQIVNEYVAKINVEVPKYTTNIYNTMIPLFISSISLNGATFTGDPGKTKKDAEHSAARAAILSILESETGVTTMSVLVKSKFKHYEELLQVKGSSTGQEQCMDSQPGPEPNLVSSQMVHLEDPNPISLLKRIRVESLETTSSVPYPVQRELSNATIPQSSAEPRPFLTYWSSASTANQISQPIPQPLLVLNRAKPSQTSVAGITTPIEFVPTSAYELAPVSATPNPVSAQMVPLEDPNPISSLKRITEPIEGTSLVPSSVQQKLSIVTIPHSSSEPFPFPTLCSSASTTNQIPQPISQPLHVFNRAKHAQTSVANIATPIEFVPASTETLAPVLSTSAKKRKNNNSKKKKRKREKHQAVLTADSLPSSQVPASTA